jgi:ribonuclease D
LIAKAQSRFIYIDTDSEFKTLIEDIKAADRISLDTEADSLHHYYEKVCLIQMSIGKTHYILDPLAETDLKDFLKQLAKKPLILHDADYDLRMMKSSFGFRPKNEVFDTKLAAQILGYTEFSLAALVKRFFDVTLPKHGKKSDWSRRPLSTAQIKYAFNDTRYLAQLADKLTRRLNKLNRLSWHKETCELMIAATGRDNNRDLENAWRIKGVSRLERKELALARSIWHWREKEAQKVDLPPFKIMVNHLILDLAVWAARYPKKSLKYGPKLPRTCAGKRFEALQKAIRKGLKVPPNEWPKQRKPTHTRNDVPDCRDRVLILRRECSRLAEELDIETSFLASRATLAAIARKRPKTTREIMESGPMMRWQADIFKPIIKALDKKLEGK